MKLCRHPHVVRLLEVIDDKLYQKVYMGQSPPPPLFPSSLCARLFCAQSVDDAWDYSYLLADASFPATGSITVMEFLGGGEIKWRDSDSNPVLRVDQSRRICRDVILGLEYR
jgi:[calcium/calmodulin-dependent protein kinase] kinase